MSGTSPLNPQQQQHSQPLQQHSQPLQQHSQPLQQHSQPLQQHSQPLQQHSQPLHQHSQPIQHQSQPLQQHPQSLQQHLQPPLQSQHHQQPAHLPIHAQQLQPAHQQFYPIRTVHHPQTSLLQPALHPLHYSNYPVSQSHQLVQPVAPQPSLQQHQVHPHAHRYDSAHISPPSSNALSHSSPASNSFMNTLGEGYNPANIHQPQLQPRPHLHPPPPPHNAQLGYTHPSQQPPTHPHHQFSMPPNTVPMQIVHPVPTTHGMTHSTATKPSEQDKSVKRQLDATTSVTTVSSPTHKKVLTSVKSNANQTQSQTNFSSQAMPAAVSQINPAPVDSVTPAKQRRVNQSNANATPTSNNLNNAQVQNCKSQRKSPPQQQQQQQQKQQQPQQNQPQLQQQPEPEQHQQQQQQHQHQKQHQLQQQEKQQLQQQQHQHQQWLQQQQQKKLQSIAPAPLPSMVGQQQSVAQPDGTAGTSYTDLSMMNQITIAASAQVRNDETAPNAVGVLNSGVPFAYQPAINTIGNAQMPGGPSGMGHSNAVGHISSQKGNTYNNVLGKAKTPKGTQLSKRKAQNNQKVSQHQTAFHAPNNSVQLETDNNQQQQNLQRNPSHVKPQVGGLVNRETEPQRNANVSKQMGTPADQALPKKLSTANAPTKNAQSSHPMGQHGVEKQVRKVDKSIAQHSATASSIATSQKLAQPGKEVRIVPKPKQSEDEVQKELHFKKIQEEAAKKNVACSTDRRNGVNSRDLLQQLSKLHDSSHPNSSMTSKTAEPDHRANNSVTMGNAAASKQQPAATKHPNGGKETRVNTKPRAKRVAKTTGKNARQKGRAHPAVNSTAGRPTQKGNPGASQQKTQNQPNPTQATTALARIAPMTQQNSLHAPNNGVQGNLQLLARQGPTASTNSALVQAHPVEQSAELAARGPTVSQPLKLHSDLIREKLAHSQPPPQQLSQHQTQSHFQQAPPHVAANQYPQYAQNLYPRPQFQNGVYHPPYPQVQNLSVVHGQGVPRTFNAPQGSMAIPSSNSNASVPGANFQNVQLAAVHNGAQAQKQTANELGHVQNLDVHRSTDVGAQPPGQGLNHMPHHAAAPSSSQPGQVSQAQHVQPHSPPPSHLHNSQIAGASGQQNAENSNPTHQQLPSPALDPTSSTPSKPQAQSTQPGHGVSSEQMGALVSSMNIFTNQSTQKVDIHQKEGTSGPQNLQPTKSVPSTLPTNTAQQQSISKLNATKEPNGTQQTHHLKPGLVQSSPNPSQQKSSEASELETTVDYHANQVDPGSGMTGALSRNQVSRKRDASAAAINAEPGTSNVTTTMEPATKRQRKSSPPLNQPTSTLPTAAPDDDKEVVIVSDHSANNNGSRSQSTSANTAPTANGTTTTVVGKGGPPIRRQKQASWYDTLRNVWPILERENTGCNRFTITEIQNAIEAHWSEIRLEDPPLNKRWRTSLKKCIATGLMVIKYTANSKSNENGGSKTKGENGEDEYIMLNINFEKNTTAGRPGKKADGAANEATEEFLLDDEALRRAVPKDLMNLSTKPVRLSEYDKAKMIEFVDKKNNVVRGHKGYRMVRASNGVSEGDWYFEAQVLEYNGDGAVRLGWCTRRSDLETPVGFDAYSFGIRDRTGHLIHKGRRMDYGSEFHSGDVIGCRIVLPTLTEMERKEISASERRFLEYRYIRFAQGPHPPDSGVNIVDKAHIEFFKNGKSMGIPKFFTAGGDYVRRKQGLEGVSTETLLKELDSAPKSANESLNGVGGSASPTSCSGTNGNVHLMNNNQSPSKAMNSGSPTNNSTASRQQKPNSSSLKAGNEENNESNPNATDSAAGEGGNEDRAAAIDERKMKVIKRVMTAGIYYPSISLFGSATVKANFGPVFKHPVPGCRPMCEAAPDTLPTGIAGRTHASAIYMPGAASAAKSVVTNGQSDVVQIDDDDTVIPSENDMSQQGATSAVTGNVTVTNHPTVVVPTTPASRQEQETNGRSDSEVPLQSLPQPDLLASATAAAAAEFSLGK